MIPPKSKVKGPWPVDYYLYKEHYLVECFFQKIKWFRRKDIGHHKSIIKYLGGVSIGNGVLIGENVFVGLGAVVVKDVAPGETVVGNPAKSFIRKNE